LGISANTLNNQGGQLAAGANLNITANTLNNTQNTDQTQGGLIYAKNQLHITAANQLLNDKSSIVAQGSILINASNISALEQTGAGNRARVDGGGGIDTLVLYYLYLILR
jgi:adhesin HecA-like repeat protein